MTSKIERYKIELPNLGRQANALAEALSFTFLLEGRPEGLFHWQAIISFV